MSRHLVSMAAAGLIVTVSITPGRADDPQIVPGATATRADPARELLQRTQRRAVSEAGSAAVRAVQRAAGTSPLGRVISGAVGDVTSIGQRTLRPR